MQKSMKLAVYAMLALATLINADADSPVQKSFALASGSGTLTNVQDFAAVQLTFQVEKIELLNTDPTAATATLRRVSNAITNPIGSLVVTAGYGLSTNAPFYLFAGDELRVTGGGTNTGAGRATGRYLP